MKKLILGALCAILGLTTAQAQTNFREISYGQALETAKAEGKLVFIDFMTDWCGPCKQMAREVFPQPKLGSYMNEHFVCIKINAEKGEGVELAKKYTVSAYPTFVVIDADQKELGRTVGGRSADEFEEEMERIVNPDKSPARIKARYAAGERTGSLISAYASLLKREAQEQAQQTRGDREQYVQQLDSITQLVQAYYATLTPQARMAADNMFVYSEYTRHLDDASARFLTDNISQFPEETKALAEKALHDIYDNAILGYFTGYQEVKPDVYAQAKKDIKRLALDSDGKLAKLQQFIDVYTKGDMQNYLEFVDKNFDSLPDESQQYLSNMFSGLFEKCDADTKKQAARVLRNHLSNLPYNVIYFAAMEIGKLEGQGH